MFTVDNVSIVSTEVKRSKFIVELVPIVMYEGLQEKLKKEHPKANHVVYAFRYLNEFSQIVENSTDDGEPKGCAGVPVLNVLRGVELVNVAVLIVRYFGGIKLGTGGMARAYALAVKNVIEKSDLVVYVKEVCYKFNTTYSDVDKTLYLLKKLSLTKYEREFCMEDVAWKVIGSEDMLKNFKAQKGL